MRDPDAGREHYVEVGHSELRKLRDSIVDPKYDGVKTSRQQLHESESASEAEEGIDGPPGSDRIDGLPSLHGDSLSSASEDDEEENEKDAHSSMHKTNEKVAMNHDSSSKIPSQNDEALTSSLQRTRVADKLKGKAVSRQLRIWDSLVDARIRLQKSVVTANRLPHPSNIPPYINTPAGRVASNAFITEALQLSEELFQLRHSLLAQSGSIQPPRKKRRIENDDEDLNLDILLEESTREMMTFDTQTHPDILSTLQKWSAKVQAVAPSALLPSSRVSFKTGPAHLKSAAELVEDALRDQGKAVKRTWGKIESGARIGGSTLEGINDEGDEEAFDDRDFYQAMLRDVIESKGGKDGVDAASLYANSKKQKTKKLVDTKASKGRKLRYEPHEKLQNFMVPMPVRGAWHDEQIDELFASLLGKGFEDRDEAVSQTLEVDMGQKAGDTLQGLKIFG
ncbi:TRAUB-domain-containing protein [Ramaria rubella]|nr:TRAUB-domain-containing protein [Ramaria rubella]